jgi:hypothetical protein
MPIQDANASPFQTLKAGVLAEDLPKHRATRTPPLRLHWVVYVLLGLMLAVQILHFELDRENYNTSHGFASQEAYGKW